MFHTKNFICLTLLLIVMHACLSAQTYSKETVVIETTLGTIKVKLFEETPLHKENFLKLAQQHYFDSLLFHRVIFEFMIQGGDPLSRYARPGDSLGHGDAGYLVPAEFNRRLVHKKGRLCAARDNDDVNPTQASSASQFYIVMGKVRTAQELIKTEEKINKRRYNSLAAKYNSSEEGKRMNAKHAALLKANKNDSAQLVRSLMDSTLQREYQKTPPYKFTEEEVKLYTTQAGTPHLDGSYTVFGEVTQGIEVVDRIASVKTDSRDRPIDDIRMKIYILNQ